MNRGGYGPGHLLEAAVEALRGGYRGQAAALARKALAQLEVDVEAPAQIEPSTKCFPSVASAAFAAWAVDVGGFHVVARAVSTSCTMDRVRQWAQGVTLPDWHSRGRIEAAGGPAAAAWPTRAAVLAWKRRGAEHVEVAPVRGAPPRRLPCGALARAA